MALDGRRAFRAPKIFTGHVIKIMPEKALPHESTHANRFISQLLDYCSENTPKGSNRSCNNPLSGLLTNTFGVFVSKIQ